MPQATHTALFVAVLLLIIALTGCTISVHHVGEYPFTLENDYE